MRIADDNKKKQIGFCKDLRSFSFTLLKNSVFMYLEKKYKKIVTQQKDWYFLIKDFCNFI